MQQRKGIMTEQQVEKIIEHLETIAESLWEIANNWPSGSSYSPVHIVDGTKQYNEDIERRNQQNEAAYWDKVERADNQHA
jgi:hypothetical protein